MADTSPYSPRDLDVDFDIGEQYLCKYLATDLRDGRFAVFVIHRESREWWRLVAIFSSWERAERYAGVENDCCDDIHKDADRPVKDAVDIEELVPAPATLPPEPESRIVSPQEILPPETREMVETILVKHSETTHTTTTSVETTTKGAIMAPLWASQDDEFTDLWQAGVAVAEISGKLGRTINAVYSRANHLKLGPHPITGLKNPSPAEQNSEALRCNEVALADQSLPAKRRKELEAINDFLRRKPITHVKPAAFATETAR